MGTQDVLQDWQDTWTDALALWSRYTQLRSPQLCQSHVEATKHGLEGSFAMIRLNDQTVVVDLEQVAHHKLDDYALEILAHEIGHHMLSPATLTDHARMIARIHVSLPTLEDRAAMVANLYSDLLINNHLKRQFNLRMDEVYQKLDRGKSQSRVWNLYLRIYEFLWQMKQGALGSHTDSDAMEGDAWLGARIIKVYADDWLKGASRFASLLLPYLAEDKDTAEEIAKLMDTKHAGGGQFPPGLIGKDAGESDVLHPSMDPELTGSDKKGENKDRTAEKLTEAPGNSGGQFREPFEYGEILKATGLNLSDHEIAVRYYKERAAPMIVPFPSKRQAVKTDLIPEGTTLWEPGEPIENVDWFGTLSNSSVVIPGVTTVQREWGYDEGAEPELEPYDLDLYVDCSGSMPNPQRNISYTTIAGAILCLSALRAGASVQVTLWSGAGQFKTTGGFERNEHIVLRALTDFIGGATAFPIHILRETHIETRRRRNSHIVVLSDDGVTTMFDQDEKGNSGWDIARQALDNAKGGGTMVLNLYWDYPTAPSNEWQSRYHDILQRAEHDEGWSIYPVSSWEDMTDFAKSFSREHYEASHHE